MKQKRLEQINRLKNLNLSSDTESETSQKTIKSENTSQISENSVPDTIKNSESSSIRGSVKSSLQTNITTNSRFSEAFVEKYEGVETNMQSYESTHLKATEKMYESTEIFVESYVNQACIMPREIAAPFENEKIPMVFK